MKRGGLDWLFLHNKREALNKPDKDGVRSDLCNFFKLEEGGFRGGKKGRKRGNAT